VHGSEPRKWGDVCVFGQLFQDNESSTSTKMYACRQMTSACRAFECRHDAWCSEIARRGRKEEGSPIHNNLGSLDFPPKQ
jgi:hypothetical protein